MVSIYGEVIANELTCIYANMNDPHHNMFSQSVSTSWGLY